jgi:hypothetical protein
MQVILYATSEDNFKIFCVIYKNEMEFKDCCSNKLYPDLPSASAPVGEVHIVEGSAHSYRLQKISEIQQELEREREKRSMLSKKYHRSVKIISAVDDSLVVCTMGLGVAGIGILSTIIAAPIAIAMEASALGAGVLSMIGSQVNKKLIMKAEKHEKIKTLTEAKLNTISDHISKALKDDMISDEEYSLILDELEKFYSMKEEIRSKIKTGIAEQTKQSLINQGREEAIKKFQEMFGTRGVAAFKFERQSAQ